MKGCRNVRLKIQLSMQGYDLAPQFENDSHILKLKILSVLSSGDEPVMLLVKHIYQSIVEDSVAELT